MSIDGIGLYSGPAGIGEYKVVPMYVMRIGNTRITSASTVPSRSLLSIDVVMRAEWPHLQGTDQASVDEQWHLEYKQYPCSVIRSSELTSFPPFFARAFSDSAALPSVNTSISRVCETVQSNCNGSNTQFLSLEACAAYLSSLPHHDPACQEKFGEYTAKGHSFMCKCEPSTMLAPSS
eukprot:576342-Prymnesium_polylepis.2